MQASFAALSSFPPSGENILAPFYRPCSRVSGNKATTTINRYLNDRLDQANTAPVKARCNYNRDLLFQHTRIRTTNPPPLTVDGDSARAPTHGLPSFHASCCCPASPAPPNATAPGTTRGLVAMDSDARPRLPSLTPNPLGPPESPTVAKGVRPRVVRLGGVAMDREARARRLGARGVVSLSSSISLFSRSGRGRD